MSEPRQLGASSLEALDKLTSPGTAEALLEIPVAELHFDPEQPRTDFAGGDVAAEDQKALQSLAENLVAVGFAQPVRVRPRPEGGFLVVTGERRLRAAQLAGLETVPCLLERASERESERLLLQISENLQRQDLKLLDLARALDRLSHSSGLSDRELAERLGRSKPWLSQHRNVLRAKGSARQALDDDLIRSAETLRLYQKAPARAQRQLLRKARTTASPITRGPVSEVLDREKQKASDSRDAEPASTSRPVFDLRLCTEDVRRLYALLREPPPSAPSEWTTDLSARIATLPLPD